MRLVVAMSLALVLSACATREDYLAQCWGNVGCAEWLAAERNRDVAGAVVAGAFIVGAAAAIAAASHSGGSGGYVYSAPVYRDGYHGGGHGYRGGYGYWGGYGYRGGCGSRGGPGWRHPNGRCASW